MKLKFIGNYVNFLCVRLAGSDSSSSIVIGSEQHKKFNIRFSRKTRLRLSYSFKSFIQCVFHRPKKKRRGHKRSCLVMSWLTLSRRLCYCFGGQTGNGAKGKQMRAQTRVKSVTRCGEPHWSANRELLSENRLISSRGEFILQNLHIYTKIT